LLNPAAAVNPAGNPKQLRARGIAQIPPAKDPSQFIPGLQLATYMTNGDMAAINAEPGEANPCSQSADACGIVNTQVLTIDPSSGRAKVDFSAPMRMQEGWFAIDQIAFGAHDHPYILGRNDVCTVCQPMSASAETLFGVTHGVPVQLGHQEGYRALAWIARSSDDDHSTR
jgi:hypothetical protein